MRRGGYAIFFLQADGRESDEEESGNEESNRTASELNEVERAIFDGRRYLGLSAPQVLSLTPREFAIEMRAFVEANNDEYEKQALLAIWHRKAQHEKRIKTTDLFKRPKDEERAQKNVEDIRAKQAETMRWLSQIEEFRGKE